jgi:Carboxypeptidase regulatory-like domain
VLRMSRAIVLVAAMGFGCGDSRNNTPPLTPSPSAPVVPQQSLIGHVADTAFRPIAGARVDVLDGPQAGLSMLSDGDGQFTYSGMFASSVTFRVSKDGYVSTTATSRVSAPGGRPWAYVRLATVDAPADIAGDYTLTFTADASCTSLPADARTRTYAATIAATPDPLVPAGTLFRVVIAGASVVPGNDGFPVGVAGSFVTLEVWNGENPGVVERLAPRTYVGIFGYAPTTVTSSDAPISAAFDGTIEYCVATADGTPAYGCTSVLTDRREHCESKNHRITLTRR